MDGERAQLVDDHPGSFRPIAPTGTGQLSPPWAAVLGLGWPLVVAICIAVEPAPADPTAAEPLWAVLAGWVLLGALVLAGANALRRSPGAIGAGAVAAAASMLFTIMCPMSGHHAAVGLWWYTQLAACLGMSWLTLGAYLRHRG